MNIGFDPTKFQERVVVDQFTRTPNTIVDDYMAEMPPLAFKCYMLILRKTIGFNKPYAKIATSVFMKSCGIKTEGAVAKNLKYLEQIGTLKVIRRTGEMNIFQLCQLKNVEKPSQTPPPPINNTTPDKQGGSTHVEQGGSTHVEQGSIKENSKENSIYVYIWEPKLENLKIVIQESKGVLADEILSMPDFKFHLGNFNAHWEDKIELTENQKTRKFASWLIHNFERSKRKDHFEKHQTKTPYQTKPKSALQQTADQWAEERFAEQQKASSIIDVNQDQVLIGGEREYF